MVSKTVHAVVIMFAVLVTVSQGYPASAYLAARSAPKLPPSFNYNKFVAELERYASTAPRNFYRPEKRNTRLNDWADAPLPFYGPEQSLQGFNQW